MKRTVSHESFLRKFLADGVTAAAYLNSVAEDKDLPFLLKAIRQVVNARGGMGALAKAVKMSRTSLYKTLSPGGNPEVSTLETILAVYGLRIGFFPIARTRAVRPRSQSPSRYGRAYYPAP